MSWTLDCLGDFRFTLGPSNVRGLAGVASESSWRE